MEPTIVPIEIGRGVVVRSEHGGFRFSIPTASSGQYANAQIDDTAGRPRRKYRWRPPVRLSLAARFSHAAAQLVGTAGFGFWNVPFGPGSARIPALPRAAWFFFGSPPHDISLAAGVPGSGWKAACIDAGRLAALMWAPLAPWAMLAMRIGLIYRWLWPRIQHSLGIYEAVVSVDLRDWHEYELEWNLGGAKFRVDGNLVMDSPVAPRGPLGFVAWMDNQYAIVTPRGRFGWGLLEIRHPQWLEVDRLAFDP